MRRTWVLMCVLCVADGFFLSALATASPFKLQRRGVASEPAPPPLPAREAAARRKTEAVEALRGGGGAVTVSSVLDSLPIGPFHATHLVRAAFAWCAFSACQELTPYIMIGMQREMGIGTFGSGLFAAAFTAGCMLGALVSTVVGDRYGRRTLLLSSTSGAAVLLFALAAAPNFATLCALRALTGTAMTVAMSIYLVWYMEFLPTTNRGALTNAFGVGWPVGRALVIGLAGAFGAGGWRRLMLSSGALFAGLAVLLGATAHESPRHLLAQGDRDGAAAVLRSVARANRSPLDEAVGPLAAAPAAADGGEGGGPLSRIVALASEHGPLLAFAFALMGALSCTTVMLDTWGPATFGSLLHGSAELPLRTMALFNMGDLAGIVLSIFVVDRIGRRGCFQAGFLGQAALLAALAALTAVPVSVRTAIGVLAASTRCFAWEAAHLWIVEAFPTRVRATALALALAVMRLASTLTLAVSGQLMDRASPAAVLFTIAGFLGVAGVATNLALPKETSGQEME
jgi:MFS family permease